METRNEIIDLVIRHLDNIYESSGSLKLGERDAVKIAKINSINFLSNDSIRLLEAAKTI